MGKEGGSEAAHQFLGEIKNNLKATYPDANVDDWSILVQVVLNLQGLATKLQACGIVTNPNEVFAFGRAFGLAQPLFSFIDAGVGKERADHKIRETLRLFLPNAQCKHVFFGPCHDNGYLVVLERYRRDYASRLTMIETRPAEPGFIDLGFKRVRFPRIFRSDNLPSKLPTVASPAPIATPTRSTSTGQMQPNMAPFVPQSTSPAPSSDSASSSTWATVGKSNSNTKTFNIASTKKAPARRCVLLNVHDERLDPELPRSDPGAEKRFAERLQASGKFCNNFHLIGKCKSAILRIRLRIAISRSQRDMSQGSANVHTDLTYFTAGESGEYCDYNHGEQLTPGEQLVLKHKARSRSCPQRTACQDVDCTFGHHCKFGSSCFLDSCWFAHSHGMDMVSTFPRLLRIHRAYA